MKARAHSQEPPQSRRVAVSNIPGEELKRLLQLKHQDPHSILGAHPTGSGVIVRTYRPDAQKIFLIVDGEPPKFEVLDEVTVRYTWDAPNPAFLPAPVVGVDKSTGFGDVPRNCFIGPHQANMDLSIGKTFRIAETQSVLFRADFLNVANHPSFANPPATDVQNPSSLAKINSSVGNSRFIQFSLKYSF